MKRTPEPEPGMAEWYEWMYEQTVAEDEAQSGALRFAMAMRRPDDPEILLPDLQASRAYLRKCMLNMSKDELVAKSFRELGALWARGALGAARYRARGGASGRARRGKRAPKAEPDD